jgi:Uma2 family endonuclease
MVPNFGGTEDTITNPSVIIEILSPDTISYDRGDKFALYRAIPSLKEYLLISSTEVLLEKFTKQSLHEWLLTEYKSSEDAITIDTTDYRTSLKEFYRDVTFENA